MPSSSTTHCSSESGKWPIDSSGEESGKRAQRIHQVMDRDADTMPELKKEGGLTSFRGEGTSGDNQSYANIEAEYSGDGFIVKPRANYSEQNTTRNFPDGVVVNQKGKNIGFALNGEMFFATRSLMPTGIAALESFYKSLGSKSDEAKMKNFIKFMFEITGVPYAPYKLFTNKKPKKKVV